MSVGSWVMHDVALEKIADNRIDWENDSLEVRLYASTSNVATSALDDATTATDQVIGNGYSADTVTGSVTRVAGATTLNITDAEFNASGGNIVARFAGLVDTTTTPDTLVAHLLLDDTPDDVTIIDGNPGRVGSPTGVATLSRA